VAQGKSARTQLQSPALELDFDEAEAAIARDSRLGAAYAPSTGSGQAFVRPDSTPRPQAQGAPSSMLLEGLKEELFQLEVEHKQGRISQQEYEKTKAALDQTLQRALKRAPAKNG